MNSCSMPQFIKTVKKSTGARDIWKRQANPKMTGRDEAGELTCPPLAQMGHLGNVVSSSCYRDCHLVFFPNSLGPRTSQAVSGNTSSE